MEVTVSDTAGRPGSCKPLVEQELSPANPSHPRVLGLPTGLTRPMVISTT